MNKAILGDILQSSTYNEFQCNLTKCNAENAVSGNVRQWSELTLPPLPCVPCAVKFIPPLEYSTPAVFNALHQEVH